MYDKRRFSVLLVDDQQLVRAGMRTMIMNAAPGSEIIEAGGCGEAIQALEQRAFDVVFLDIDLREGRSGIDILRYVRGTGELTRVIMLAASDEPETVIGCIAAGASGYIAKGVGDESVFERALTTVFADGVYLPASVVGRVGQARTLAEASSLPAEVKLSPRQWEVLYYLCQGLSNKMIAKRMSISEGTVRKSYVTELLRQFQVTRRTALIVEVSRRGIQVPTPHDVSEPSGSSWDVVTSDGMR